MSPQPDALQNRRFSAFDSNNRPFEDRCVQGARRPSAVAQDIRAMSEGGDVLGGTRPNGRPGFMNSPG